MKVEAPPSPKVRVSVGVTGHRQSHPGYAANADRIETVIGAIMTAIDTTAKNAPLLLGPDSLAPIRLHTLLVDGTDQVAANLANDREWEVISPLPFGENLNLAINAEPGNAGDARALLAGRPAEDDTVNRRVEAIRAISDQAHVFELADQDTKITDLYLAMLDQPDSFSRAQDFAHESAQRAFLAGRILIEQSDLLIAIWDGKSTANIGGAGHLVAAALELGSPVIWINPESPDDWKLLRVPESLANISNVDGIEDRDTGLNQIIATVICPDREEGLDQASKHQGLGTLLSAKWHDRSARLTHGYRRIEALFDNEKKPLRSLVQHYETPTDIAQGSGAKLLAEARNLKNADPEITDKIETVAMRNFGWADGISDRLSDHYRGGMIINFLLSSFAIVGGILYLPLVPAEQKWIFALFEFVLLIGIVVITFRGRKYRWHGRWFETRRVAEYFRHSPVLLMLGIARAPGRWPCGTETSWPEWYVRQALRGIGLPRTKVTADYLRSTLCALLDHHVVPQRDYHHKKARRLKHVHHRLDRFSEFLFGLAILSVATYLMLKGLSEVNLINADGVGKLSKTFTVLGVLFPTFGAAIAGIRYFGDFERFAAISEVTAEKLDAINDRSKLLLEAPDSEIDYSRVAALAQATDDIVVSEIENWQAVFGGKNITVPV
ncbi:hypothetical protein [Parasphingorhabdus sp.]|uniref:hypothetical protein n=1 Tax=Parasphingorhabdus sp. TaxID=2709688 RepID=UPI0032636E0E